MNKFLRDFIFIFDKIIIKIANTFSCFINIKKYYSFLVKIKLLNNSILFIPIVFNKNNIILKLKGYFLFLLLLFF